MKKEVNNELRFIKLLKYFWRMLPLIVLVMIVSASITFNYYQKKATTIYEGKATFAIQTNVSINEKSGEISEGSFIGKEQVSSNIVSMENFCYLASAPTTLANIISRADLPLSVDQLSSMISVSLNSLNSTVFTVCSQGQDRNEVLQIAQAFGQFLPGELVKFSPVSPVMVLDSGSVAEQRTSRLLPIKKAGFFSLAVAFLCFCGIAVKYSFDEVTGRLRIDTSDLLGLCPDTKLLCALNDTKDIEALQRLRANLLLAFPDNSSCHTLGLTAAHSDLDKDQLAYSLSCSISKLGYRVLLVEADPYSHVLDKLADEDCFSFADFISKTSHIDSIKRISKDESTISYIPFGKNVEDYSTLLYSRNLFPMIEELKSEYDYIIFNLESIGTSVDAASFGKNLDGVIVFFREGKCLQKQLENCLLQLQYAKTRLLGLVSEKRLAKRR